MPIDADGLYKNIFKLATVPAKIAAQERATLEAAMLSFTIPQDLVGQLFEPANSQPGASGGGAAGAQDKGAQGKGAQGKGAQGNGAQGNGAQGNGAQANAAQANGAPPTTARTNAAAGAGSATPQQTTGAQKMAEAHAINASTIAGMRSSNRNAECFDLVVLRETPKSQLPRKCGGLAPN
jgi:hypothetical protein